MSDVMVYATHIEETAQDQINAISASPAMEGARIRIMPDVHSGKGCVIGFTAQKFKHVIPNLIGVDIGCGVSVASIKKVSSFKMLDDIIKATIPSGMAVHDENAPIVKGSYWESRLKELECYDELHDIDRLLRSMGTLGSGNHFIELDRGTTGDYLIVHSGSRNLGTQIADIYQKRAIQHCAVNNEESREKIIQTCKAEGRTRNIQKELLALKNAERIIPEELSWLSEEDEKKYFHDIQIAQEFAKDNRVAILCNIISAMQNYDPEQCMLDFFESKHNYIDFSGESPIIRKGAISAREGEKVIIPLNMRDGCIIGIGKGNSDWNYSAPHGAGRIMSRAAAKNNLKLDDFRESMSGVYSTTVCAETIDEAPMAYKPAKEIEELVADTVNIVEIIKPVYNYKATEKQKPWEKKEKVQQ